MVNAHLFITERSELVRSPSADLASNCCPRTWQKGEALMGQNAVKFSHVLKGVRENEEELTAVNLDGVELTEKAVRKLGDALRTNR